MIHTFAWQVNSIQPEIVAEFSINNDIAKSLYNILIFIQIKLKFCMFTAVQIKWLLDSCVICKKHQTKRDTFLCITVAYLIKT